MITWLRHLRHRWRLARDPDYRLLWATLLKSRGYYVRDGAHREQAVSWSAKAKASAIACRWEAERINPFDLPSTLWIEDPALASRACRAAYESLGCAPVPRGPLGPPRKTTPPAPPPR